MDAEEMFEKLFQKSEDITKYGSEETKIYRNMRKMTGR